MKYSRDFKYSVCKDGDKNSLSVKDLSTKYSVPIATIKNWVNIYISDPFNAFKKPDITGGLSNEMQRSSGLIKIVRSEYLCGEKEMSETAYSEYCIKIGKTELKKSDIETDADEILKELLTTENSIYQAKSELLLKNTIPYYNDNIYGSREDSYPSMRNLVNEMNDLYLDIKDGKINEDAFIETVSSKVSPIIHYLSASIGQSSKSRAGAAFENHLEKLFSICKIDFETQIQEKEGKTIIDFVIPSLESSKKAPAKTASIECQTTLKDRFRLTTGKTLTTDMQCYLATPTGVGIFTKSDFKDITLQKVSEIIYEDKVTLVVFPEVKKRIISMLEENLNLIKTKPTSDKIQLTEEVCESLLRQKDTKIISFTELIKNEMPSLLIYWKSK